jgi:hypothetical protein
MQPQFRPLLLTLGSVLNATAYRFRSYLRASFRLGTAASKAITLVLVVAFGYRGAQAVPCHRREAVELRAAPRGPTGNQACRAGGLGGGKPGRRHDSEQGARCLGQQEFLRDTFVDWVA